MGRRAEFARRLESDAACKQRRPGRATLYRFGRPTDVAWDAAGNIFISDGYTNSRVVKYDKNGRFIKGDWDQGSGPGQINTPHSIQTDAKGNVYVADRGNRRIQVFSNDLWCRRSTTTWALPGRCALRPARINIFTARIPTRTTRTRPWQQCHGRNLQDGVGRDGNRKIRQGRHSIEGVYHRSCNGLPK